MASIIAHAVCAVAIGESLRRTKMPRHFWWLIAFSAMLPDLDVIGFAHGIEYGDFLGHRGFSHSILFAAIWAAVITMLAFREYRMGIFISLFLATASHGVLDAMTNGGLGIAFLSPFDTTRYFFDFQPIQVSPIGIGAFFSQWGLRVIISEAIWIGLPCTVLLLLTWTFRKFRPIKD